MNDTFRSQFRLPNELADKLRDAAEAAGRSMNAELIARLQSTFDRQAQQEGVPEVLRNYFDELMAEALENVQADDGQRRYKLTFHIKGDADNKKSSK